MKRTIEQWKNCIPSAMVHQSDAALEYALEDAKSDIIALYNIVERLSMLNKNANEIGAGMLASFIEDSNRLINRPTGQKE